MSVRYKAVRPDGTDFRTGTVNYLAGGIITAPRTSRFRPHTSDAEFYLSVATVSTDCTGMRWPCRLLAVEPLYEWTPDAEGLPNKRACRSLRVVDELRAHEALGPQGEKVAALIERARALTRDEGRRLAQAWAAARDAARAAARDAAWDAARALVVADLITDEQFHALAGPWADVIGDPR